MKNFTSQNFFLLSVSVSSQCAWSEVKSLTEDRGCDSVLLGQSNRTPHGAVTDEYGAMVELYLQGKPKNSEKTCPVPLCPPQIPHGLTRARTRASAVRGQRLTAWAMARPPTPPTEGKRPNRVISPSFLLFRFFPAFTSGCQNVSPPPYFAHVYVSIYILWVLHLHLLLNFAFQKHDTPTHMDERLLIS
jgi:hypothetical protein